MESDRFNLPILGDVSILKVYEYYDRPIVFSVQSDSGYFLMSLVESRKSSDKWLTMPLSIARLEFIENGKISLKDAFLEASNGTVIIFDIDLGGENISYTVLERESIIDSLLPDPDYYINIHSSNFSEVSPITLAQTVGLTIVNLRLIVENGNKSSVLLKNIGIFFQNFQDLIDNVAMNILGRSNLRGRIPNSITQQTALEYAGNFNSSVGISLISKNEAMLQSGTLSNSLEIVGYLLDSRGSIPDIARFNIERDIELTERSLLKFKGMLISLSGVDAGLQFEWQDREGRIGMHSADSSEIKTALHEIGKYVDSASRLFYITGKFSSGNINTQRFTIIDEETEIQYSGYSEESMDKLGIPIELGKRYKSLLRETLSLNSVSGQETYTYALIALKVE